MIKRRHTVRHGDDAVVAICGGQNRAIHANIRCHSGHHQPIDSPATQRQLERRSVELVIRVRLNDEVTFPFKALTSFRDMESGTQLMGDPLRQRRTYLARFESFREAMRAGCAQSGIDYRFVDTTEPIELVLRDYLLYRRERAR